MGAITEYALQVALILAALYLLYKWTLAGTTFCRFNRGVLMSIYAVAFIAVPLTALTESSAADDASEEISVEALKEEMGSLSETPAPMWPAALAAIYLAGVGTAAVMTIRSAIHIRNIVRQGLKEKYGTYTIVRSDMMGISPFSWGRYIVMPENIRQEDFRMVVAHETAHLRHRHWIDLAFGQAVVIFNWFNPAAYLMMRELQDVHEFEADAEVVKSGIDERQYQLLLLRNVTGSLFPILADSLNHSRLKTRLKLMMAPRTNPLRKISAALAVPVIMAAVASFNLPVLASHLSSISGASLFPTYYNEVEYAVEGNVHTISYTQSEGPVSVSMDVRPGAVPDIYIDRHLSSREGLRGIRAEDVVYVGCDNRNNRFIIKTR